MPLAQQAAYIDFRKITCQDAWPVLKHLSRLSENEVDLRQLSLPDLAMLDACISHTKSCLNQECLNLGNQITAQKYITDYIEQNKVLAIKSSG